VRQGFLVIQHYKASLKQTQGIYCGLSQHKPHGHVVIIGSRLN